jgi:hypothetical protein
MQQIFSASSIGKFSKKFDQFLSIVQTENCIDPETANDIRYLVEEYLSSSNIEDDLYSNNLDSDEEEELDYALENFGSRYHVPVW